MTKRSVSHGIFCLERSYDAAPARVFSAFATEAHTALWFSGPNAARLFPDRQQQILAETPIQKRADLGVHAHHLHGCELTYTGARDLCRGDQPILAVAVDKDFEIVARLRAFGDVLAGKQDLTQLLSIEVHAG